MPTARTVQGAVPTTVGIIGCGSISDAYFRGASDSKFIRIKACADVNIESANAKARHYDVIALSVEALLADSEIEIVINLTPPSHHAPLGMRILEAGKHLYLEKPLATRMEDATALLQFAAISKLRVGCAPDTFLGASHQAARAAIDHGYIGTAIGGSIAVLNRGMEDWHPNPEFFYQPGGGPMLDLGPYYVTQLVNLLGPVRRVTAVASTGLQTRVIGSGVRKGAAFDVHVPTTVNGAIDFVRGANLSVSASWDVWDHGRPPIEIYGTEGSLQVPDPNYFGGTPSLSHRGGGWAQLDISQYSYGTPNRELASGQIIADYRAAGVIDMARAIQQGTAHRACGTLALHVLEVLAAFERSSCEGRHIDIKSRCERPAALPPGAF